VSYPKNDRYKRNAGNKRNLEAWKNDDARECD
jgi:hypothetical protein